ncbi:GNAT family N-acetyltransferase [Commensalibacter oyaizuii]|uniref:N-acetyltransferase family protein n=1 Tax=Commensalibacter oyaizuii TaxID=3043873 RepID=A0ABT6PZC3_9PROT|nr:GNAT family N-acetyltransferase [Commensalibacter sp. TBRC 16381]MDI2090201.1 N-acetyltransferase family protein [Commensalibacter sp. TBRC 16381]
MTHIRHAIPSDLRDILEITNREIICGTAFWMTVPRTYEEQVQWFEARQAAGYPVFVAVNENQKILGYASYGSFRPYDGYKYTVEHSVYVDPAAQGQGLGKQLMQKIINYAENHQVHAMVAGITDGNIASIRLHEWFGFKRAGVLPQTGIKFDQWLDLLFMYKILTPSS